MAQQQQQQQQQIEREFWQFGDQLRLQSANFSSLSIGDSIWSLDTAHRNVHGSSSSDLLLNTNNPNSNSPGLIGSGKLAFGTTATNRNANRYNFPSNDNNNKDTLTTPYHKNKNNNNNDNIINPTNYYYNSTNGSDAKNYFNKSTINTGLRPLNNNNNNNNGHGHGSGKKNNSDGGAKKKNANNNNNNNNNAGVDKRFKSLPASEALPRNEAIGGYIFVCNNDTMEENLKRQLFGLPSRYRDSVRAIRPGLPLFLYNYSTHQLHGIFEAASFGGTNIDPSAWEDKKCSGESRFPAQVRVVTRKICDPLEEDAFRPILHHYDGPKFRLELSVPETIALLDIFAA